MATDEEKMEEAVKALAHVGGMSDDEARDILVSVLNAYREDRALRMAPPLDASKVFSVDDMNDALLAQLDGHNATTGSPDRPEHADPRYHALARQPVVADPRTNGRSQAPGTDARPWWATGVNSVLPIAEPYGDGFPAGGI